MKRNDIYLAGALIAAAIIIWLLLRSFSAEADKVRVSVDGELFGEYPIDEDAQILITGADGGSNLLVIKDGKADITEADCPDKLCVHQAPVSRSKEAIVCLPHRVVVTVEGKGGETYDALTR